jgi:ferredoxin
MPLVQAQGKTIECDLGANLRQVLLKHGVDLYNGPSPWVNCRSLGTCGTCCVAIEGPISPLTWKEKARLSIPPHLEMKSLARDRRLACQVQVLGDLKVTKFNQFWGESETVRWSADAS